MTATAAEALAAFLMWRFDITADEAARSCITFTPIARREALRMSGLKIAKRDMATIWDDARTHLLASA